MFTRYVIFGSQRPFLSLASAKRNPFKFLKSSKYKPNLSCSMIKIETKLPLLVLLKPLLLDQATVLEIKSLQTTYPENNLNHSLTNFQTKPVLLDKSKPNHSFLTNLIQITPTKWFFLDQIINQISALWFCVNQKSKKKLLLTKSKPDHSSLTKSASNNSS